jgi:hypothetical protein
MNSSVSPWPHLFLNFSVWDFVTFCRSHYIISLNVCYNIWSKYRSEIICTYFANLYRYWRSTWSLPFTKYYSRLQITENEMNRACGTYGWEERWIEGFGRELEGKRPLGRSRHRREDNIKTDIKEMVKYCLYNYKLEKKHT